jgi:hypothetical protein
MLIYAYFCLLYGNLINLVRSQRNTLQVPRWLWLQQTNDMTYKDKLNPWCIICPVSSVQMRIVGSFAAELTQKDI